MPKSVTKAAFNAVGTTRHSASHNMPASSPSAANSSPGCGPESPIGTGSGGSSSTAPKKRTSQRAGVCRVHQSTGAISAGAASTAFIGRLRVTAIAAAHTANTGGAHHADRRCDALLIAMILPRTFGPNPSRDREGARDAVSERLALRLQSPAIHRAH